MKFRKTATPVLGKPSFIFRVFAWTLGAIGTCILVAFFGLLASHLGWHDGIASVLILLPIGAFGFVVPGGLAAFYESRLKNSCDKAKTINLMRSVSICVALLGILAFAAYTYANYKEIKVASQYLVSGKKEGIEVSGLGIPNGQLMVTIDPGIDTLKGANTVEPYYEITGDITISLMGINRSNYVKHVHHGNLPNNGLVSYNGGYKTVGISALDQVRLPEQITTDNPCATISFVGDVASAYSTGSETYGTRNNKVEYNVTIPVKPYHGSALPDVDDVPEMDYLFQCACLFVLCCAALALMIAEHLLVRNNNAA